MIENIPGQNFMTIQLSFPYFEYLFNITYNLIETPNDLLCQQAPFHACLLCIQLCKHKNSLKIFNFSKNLTKNKLGGKSFCQWCENFLASLEMQPKLFICLMLAFLNVVTCWGTSFIICIITKIKTVNNFRCSLSSSTSKYFCKGVGSSLDDSNHVNFIKLCVLSTAVSLHHVSINSLKTRLLFTQCIYISRLNT